MPGRRIYKPIASDRMPLHARLRHVTQQEQARRRNARLRWDFWDCIVAPYTNTTFHLPPKNKTDAYVHSLRKMSRNLSEATRVIFYNRAIGFAVERTLVATPL